MASLFFDSSGKGVWKVSYNAGAHRGRVTVRIGPHPGGWSKARPPKKAPPEYRTYLDHYEKLEREQRTGLRPSEHRTTMAVYLAGKVHDPNIKPPTQITRRTAMRRWLPWCEEVGLADLQDVGVAECRRFLGDMVTKGPKGGAGPLAPSTAKVTRGILRAIWGQAVEEGLVDRNPWDRARVRVKDDGKGPDAWTADEVAAIAGAMPHEFARDVFLFGVNTGLRISAILASRWAWVRADGLAVVVPPEHAKVDRQKVVPLTRTARQILDRRGPGAPDGLIFARRADGRPVRYQTSWRWIGRACEAAGVSVEAGRFNHKMRHTAASLLANTPGINLADVRDFLGHSNLTITNRYVHSEDPHRAAELYDVDPAGGDAPGPTPGD